VPAADRHIMTVAELDARLTVLMGGYAAERTILGDISSGAENDLKEATRLATRMMANYGMSKKLGAVYYEHESEHPFLGQLIATESGTSDATISTIETEARAELASALAKAIKVIEAHRSEMQRLVQLLLERETAERADLERILGVPESNGAPGVPTEVPPIGLERSPVAGPSSPVK